MTGSYWFPKPYADRVAKLRVPCGFLLLLTFAWLASPSRQSLLVGLPVSVAGLAIRAWAAGHLAKNRDLATGGPYAWVRNPLYLGTLIVALGVVLACRNWVLAAVFAAIFLLVYLPVIELEEQHLRSLFPAYEAYAARVPKLWGARRGAPSVAQAFDAATYLKNREYEALLGFLAGAGYLAAKMMWFR